MNTSGLVQLSKLIIGRISRNATKSSSIVIFTIMVVVCMITASSQAYGQIDICSQQPPIVLDNTNTSVYFYIAYDSCLVIDYHDCNCYEPSQNCQCYVSLKYDATGGVVWSRQFTCGSTGNWQHAICLNHGNYELTVSVSSGCTVTVSCDGNACCP